MYRPVRRFFGTLLMLIAATAAQAQGEFPGRALFVQSTPIELGDLHSRLGQVTIVDVRSTYEFETLHIKDAVHLGLYETDFGKQAKALREKTGKRLVFYCNGRTCYKSYKADGKAQGAGVRDSFVFDAGVFEWTQAYPDQAVLLGESPVDPAKLISKTDFESHLLSPTDFLAKVKDQTLVLDIREVRQRSLIGAFILDTNIPLNDTDAIKKFIAKTQAAKKPLFVYDMAGKQVRWFQYLLEDLGVKEYYFMRGGMKAYFDEIIRNR